MQAAVEISGGGSGGSIAHVSMADAAACGDALRPRGACHSRVRATAACHTAPDVARRAPEPRAPHRPSRTRVEWLCARCMPFVSCVHVLAVGAVG